MIKRIDFSKADLIVELGAGDGAITKEILKKLHPEATLVCFEVNQKFYSQLKKIQHPRLKVLNSSAEMIREELKELGFSKSCHIISSLPLTMIPDVISQNILQNSYAILEDNGTFIQYQYSPVYFKKLNSVFHHAVSLDFEVLNMPPAFIYRCEKVG